MNQKCVDGKEKRQNSFPFFLFFSDVLYAYWEEKHILNWVKKQFASLMFLQNINNKKVIKVLLKKLEIDLCGFLLRLQVKDEILKGNNPSH